MRALARKRGARDPSPGVAAMPALWVKRDAALQALAVHASPIEAGGSVWSTSEPWIAAVQAAAAGPAVLLAELDAWASLLDRHSTVSLEVERGRTRVRWEGLGALTPDARECAFRLGALAALVRSPDASDDFEVRHARCRARGDDECAFSVDGLVARADPRHARLLAEAMWLASARAGREALWRRLAALSARSGPFPDVRGAREVRRFIEELEAPVVVFDRGFAVLDANRAAVRMAGLSLDELRGLSARDLLDAQTFRRVEQWRARLLEAGALRGLVIEGRFRGRSVALEVSARVSAGGQTVVVIARDVSEHQRLERELESRNRELREQNARMGEADRLKSEFLANISHELTTPLTAIKGFAKLLLGDFTAELAGGATRLPLDKRFEFVAIVQQEAERMTELIRGLLELSKIESGVVSLDRSSVPLNRIVRESLLVCKPRLDERSLVLATSLDPALPPALLDPDRIKQVVLNLLDNAIKFSTPGGRIDVSTARSGATLVLAVGNPSAALEPADLDRIFERFVQRDGSFARAHGGVGLGLNLVRGIVALHGGRVRAELPEPGRFRVVVELPACRCTGAAKPRPTASLGCASLRARFARLRRCAALAYSRSDAGPCCPQTQRLRPSVR